VYGNLPAPALTPCVLVTALAWSRLASQAPSLYAESSTTRHCRPVGILACPFDQCLSYEACCSLLGSGVSASGFALSLWVWPSIVYSNLIEFVRTGVTSTGLLLSVRLVASRVFLRLPLSQCFSSVAGTGFRLA
jgi:hypothetical protein